MGNKQSCCITQSPKANRKKPVQDNYVVERETVPPQPTRVASTSSLQHISEREPDDTDNDPSSHPKALTLFLAKSDLHKNNKLRRRSQYDNHFHGSYGQLSKKYSSCSTIYMDDSTVSNPNLKNTIKAVALAIYFLIRNRQTRDNYLLEAEGKLLDIFDEKLHPLSKKEPIPEDYDHRDPEHKAIYRFIRTLFNAAQLTAECAIVTLVYLERLLTYAEIEICPSNWKRMVLGGILLGSKVWDDQAVWNVDYCQILKDISVDDMNELERQFLEMLQFNINVPSSVYAKYYFDLRTLADSHDLSFPVEPLSKERAAKLEAMSNVCEDRLRSQLTQNRHLKRSQSLDGLTTLPRPTKAILS